MRTPGADTRGSSLFTPAWQVFHHTASAAGANAPALGICTHGRSDLPGPLCNILVGRDGTMFYVAAGRANHAGLGRYPDGTTGNHLSIGWECENNGIGEPWPERQLDAIARGQAAVGERLGLRADRVIYHRTFAPSRKIDPSGPGVPVDVTAWQARVSAATQGAEELTDQEWEKLGDWLQDQTRNVIAAVTAEVRADRRMTLDLVEAVSTEAGVDPIKVRARLKPETRAALDKVS